MYMYFFLNQGMHSARIMDHNFQVGELKCCEVFTQKRIRKILAQGLHITANKETTFVYSVGSIKHSVGTANANVFSILCKSFVQQSWNMRYLAREIHALESVQRRASTLALNQHKGDMSTTM